MEFQWSLEASFLLCALDPSSSGPIKPIPSREALLLHMLQPLLVLLLVLLVLLLVLLVLLVMLFYTRMFLTEWFRDSRGQ